VKPSQFTNNKLIIIFLDVIPYHPHLPHLILSSCVTSWKVAGSIPDGVIGFFIDLILLAALWPGGQLTTQPLAEMSTKDISCGGKVS